MVIIPSWERFQKYLFYDQELGLFLDISRMNFPDEFLVEMTEPMKKVYRELEQLERGSIANPDEGRMVGHYWLRNPDLAPSPEIAAEIRETLISIIYFVDQIHRGAITGEKGKPFCNLLLIGIGGSSLGPRFVADALGSCQDKMNVFFIDNTDPDGIDRTLKKISDVLESTLCIVISKSGGTIDTRNGMLEVKLLYEEQELSFAKHAVAVTQKGSKLDQICQNENWLEAFPMWDWVGGRTSLLSAVGLLPLALQGINIYEILQGAKECDERTRSSVTRSNPAALLALMWYYATRGKGGKEMIVLPYKDRLELLTKYLQQLIMESLGKEKNLQGEIVHQGLTVYGNKGSTDQHSYLQQLLEGPSNFFITFIEVLQDRQGISSILVDNSTSGDYLQAFLLGTREALTKKGRESITITVKDINAYTIGVLIALFERAVSIYALLADINAYNQPAVEMGKKVAGVAIGVKNKLLEFLHSQPGVPYSVSEITSVIGEEGQEELIFKTLRHLTANPEHGVKINEGENILGDKYFMEKD